MHFTYSLVPIIAMALAGPVWSAGPTPTNAPSAVIPTSAVNPYTGTEPSVAALERALKVERLKTQIADEKHRQERAASEMKKMSLPEGMPKPGQFGTLKYPSEKMPDLGNLFFTPGGKDSKGIKGRQLSLPPPMASAMSISTPATTPVVPAGPRLVGVIRDDAGRVAIIEQGGVLKQVKEGESAHGQKVAKIGDGWAEVGGRRLVQDNSTLALVTNVDKQPSARLASASGTSMAAAVSMQPAAQAVPFTPPSFQ